jgi:regulator of cell morphogenesis and NO signaling
MTITESTLIADIAADVPSSVRVFQRYSVDFCCGGKRPLAVACEEQGLSFSDIRREIELVAAAPAAAQRDWNTASLHDLTDHIVTAYHEPLREEMPRLAAMAARVARVHGQKAPRLLGRIEAVVGELSADLTEHMRKEELVLFPVIRGIENGGTSPMPLDRPIHVMELEHDRAGELLAELRALTAGYAPPGWACATARALYQGLAELEASMHVHVHLENNVLFPRAIALAAPGVEGANRAVK